MKPDLKKRVLYFVLFVSNIIAILALSVALGTNYWIVSYPEKLVDNKTSEAARNVTNGHLETKFKGYINFGLFNGYKELDHGLGVRKIDIVCKLNCMEFHVQLIAYIYYRFIVRSLIVLNFLFITFFLHFFLSWTSSLSISNVKFK